MTSLELRIFNYLQSEEGKLLQVAAISIDQISCFIVDKTELVVDGSEFKPIPITEEWLVKFGFISDGIKHLTHSIHKLTVDVRLILMYQIVYEQPEISTLYIKGIQLISTITYVHQLQNLYYALTGKELTI